MQNTIQLLELRKTPFCASSTSPCHLLALSLEPLFYLCTFHTEKLLSRIFTNIFKTVVYTQLSFFIHRPYHLFFFFFNWHSPSFSPSLKPTITYKYIPKMYYFTVFILAFQLLNKESISAIFY